MKFVDTGMQPRPRWRRRTDLQGAAEGWGLTVALTLPLPDGLWVCCWNSVWQQKKTYETEILFAVFNYSIISSIRSLTFDCVVVYHHFSEFLICFRLKTHQTSTSASPSGEQRRLVTDTHCPITCADWFLYSFKSFSLFSLQSSAFGQVG